jgi:hypothetical protein
MRDVPTPDVKEWTADPRGGAAVKTEFHSEAISGYVVIVIRDERGLVKFRLPPKDAFDLSAGIKKQAVLASNQKVDTQASIRFCDSPLRNLKTEEL